MLRGSRQRAGGVRPPDRRTLNRGRGRYSGPDCSGIRRRQAKNSNRTSGSRDSGDVGDSGDGDDSGEESDDSDYDLGIITYYN